MSTVSAGDRLVVDRDLCVGAGQCVLSAPDLFDQSEEDGRVLVSQTLGTDPARARAAVRLCPSGALSLISTDT